MGGGFVTYARELMSLALNAWRNVALIVLKEKVSSYELCTLGYMGK